MLRKCTQADRARLMDYIAAEPEINLFFYGDVENFGLEQEQVQVYVQEEGESWRAALLRFFDSYTLYSRDGEFDEQEIAHFLKAQEEMDCLSGKIELIQRIAVFFPELTLRRDYMARFDLEKAEEARDSHLRRLGMEDVDERFDLLEGIEEFHVGKRGSNPRGKFREEMESNLKHGAICLGAYEQGRLVSTASTTAVNSQSAMIVGVATHRDYRGKGYATRVMKALCSENRLEGRKFLCLFYDNPAAGRIYHRIGFEDVGEYAMLRAE